MKKSLLSLALVISFSFSVFAKPEIKNRRNGNKVEKELNLSDEQKNQLKTINEEFKTEKEELKKQSNLTKEEKTAKFKELATGHRSKIDGILTEDQKSKMDEMKHKDPRMDEPRKNQANRKHVQSKKSTGNINKSQHSKSDRKKDIEFSDEQKESLNALRENFNKKREEIDNMALTKTDRQNKLKELRDDHRKQIDKILTDEQKSKMNKPHAGNERIKKNHKNETNG